ncbi:DNA polymerase alpha accessory factor Mcl1, partial [Spiromyces aspiralis]
MLSETTEPSERFAHSEGYTAVKFSYDGIYFFTGGNDSLVRAFKTDKSERDQEAQTLEYHSDAVLAFDVGRNKLITCGQDAVSFSFRVPMHNDDHNQQISPEGTVARSTLTICDVSVSANGLLVAVAAHENTVSIVSLIDMTIVYKLEGHPGPVNSVDFSSDSRYLASAGCDGTIKIWDMQMDAPDCIQTLERFSPACPVGD